MRTCRKEESGDGWRVRRITPRAPLKDVFQAYLPEHFQDGCMRLASAAASFKDTALRFGSHRSMLKQLHTLWDPPPPTQARVQFAGTDWIGLRNLGHYVALKDMRVSQKRTQRSI